MIGEDLDYEDDLPDGFLPAIDPIPEHLLDIITFEEYVPSEDEDVKCYLCLKYIIMHQQLYNTLIQLLVADLLELGRVKEGLATIYGPTIHEQCLIDYYNSSPNVILRPVVMPTTPDLCKPKILQLR